MRMRWVERVVLAGLTVVSPDDLEVRHHPGGVVLEDVAVVHRLACPVMGHERDPNAGLARHVHRVLPRLEGRWVAVHLEHLEEEPVQVERVTHHRVVDDVPHLQLANLDRRSRWCGSLLTAKSTWRRIGLKPRWTRGMNRIRCRPLGEPVPATPNTGSGSRRYARAADQA
jgi:hypothetical protein